MATSKEYGLGEFDFARGWFMVGTSADATRTPAPIRYFGKDLVIYRGESGKPYIVDAYCPHMGAHRGAVLRWPRGPDRGNAPHPCRGEEMDR